MNADKITEIKNEICKTLKEAVQTKGATDAEVFAGLGFAAGILMGKLSDSMEDAKGTMAHMMAGLQQGFNRADGDLDIAEVTIETELVENENHDA